MDIIYWHAEFERASLYDLPVSSVVREIAWGIPYVLSHINDFSASSRNMQARSGLIQNLDVSFVQSVHHDYLTGVL
jgi:hypothetical protein